VTRKLCAIYFPHGSQVNVGQLWRPGDFNADAADVSVESIKHWPLDVFNKEDGVYVMNEPPPELRRPGSHGYFEVRLTDGGYLCVKDEHVSAVEYAPEWEEV
jgi:hypothetical protein